jgi:hypothetical protein
MTTIIIKLFEDGQQTLPINLSFCPEDVYSDDQRSYRFYANAPIRLNYQKQFNYLIILVYLVLFLI